MEEPVVVLGYFLILEREREESFLPQLHMSGGGQTAFGRPLDRNIIGCWRLFAPPFAPIYAFEIGHQEDGDLGQRGSDFGREGRHRLLQVFPEVIVGHREGGAEIGEGVAKRDHLAAEAFGELADAQLAELDLGWHLGTYILADAAHSGLLRERLRLALVRNNMTWRKSDPQIEGPFRSATFPMHTLCYTFYPHRLHGSR